MIITRNVHMTSFEDAMNIVKPEQCQGFGFINNGYAMNMPTKICVFLATLFL